MLRALADSRKGRFIGGTRRDHPARFATGPFVTKMVPYSFTSYRSMGDLTAYLKDATSGCLNRSVISTIMKYPVDPI